MDLNPIVLAKVLLPKTPFFLKTAVLSALSLSENASLQDTRTELIVSVIRELLKRPNTIGKFQRGSFKDPDIKGRMWISKVKIPMPNDTEGISPAAAIDIVVKELGDGLESYTRPDTASVEAEWTGFRSGVDARAPRPDISEAEHYERMMADVKSDVTVLYFHGGAHFLMDPWTHRIPVSRLAKLNSGRCLSVRYRLAPQNPFPASLLDALIAYLFLLCPPDSSLHSPVPASHIVLAGDSAGGNLSLSLLLTLLTLRNRGIHTLRFHGVDVPLLLPAGVAMNSPWCDISTSLPSHHQNARLDWLSPLPEFGSTNKVIPDDIWPTSPPRIELFTNASTLFHPLVTPLAASPEMWRDAPPVYMCVGNELLEDEATVVAKKMHSVGVDVRFDGYEGMPHCFGILFQDQPIAMECMQSWAGFMRDVVEGKLGEMEHRGKATWTKALSNPVERLQVPWEELAKELPDDEVDRLLKAKRYLYVKREEAMVTEWRGKQAERFQVKL